MTSKSMVRRVVRMLLIAVTSAAASLSADESSHLYRVTTETGMPHLEESLRNLTTHETRCIREHELFTAFPVLDYAALRGCSLQPNGFQGDAASYELICDGAQRATGRAVWSGSIGEGRLAGTLSVKLGGKNMTFYQRVTAVRVGECAVTSE